MGRFIDGEDRTQSVLFPERLDDWIDEDNPVRVVDVFGYLNRIQSSRRLEREAQRNVELIWLTSRPMPDFKTIADFRKDNGEATGLIPHKWTCPFVGGGVWRDTSRKAECNDDNA